MRVLLYLVVAAVFLAVIGLVATYRETKHRGVLTAALIQGGAGIAALYTGTWWPLLAAFGLLWGVRLLGGDPGWRPPYARLRHDITAGPGSPREADELDREPAPEEGWDGSELARRWGVLSTSLNIVISREEIEEQDIDPALHILESLLASRDRLTQHRGRVTLSVSGYDLDPRELFVIPEVRSYFAHLDEAFPFWFYFASREDETLKLVTFCLCRARPVGPGLTWVDPTDKAAFMMAHFHALNELFEAFDLPEEDNERISEEVADYYESFARA